MEMKRSDFLKMCLAGLAGAIALRWLKIFDNVSTKHVKEARFYRSADTLLG